MKRETWQIAITQEANGTRHTSVTEVCAPLLYSLPFWVEVKEK